MSNTIIKYVAKEFPKIIAIGSISGILMAVLLNRFDFAVRGLVVAIPSFLAAFFLNKIYETNITTDKIIDLFTFDQKRMIVTFGVLYLNSVTILLLNNNRTWTFIIITLLLYTLIFLQVFSKKSTQKVILIEIMLLMLINIYSITLKYPFYFGGTDLTTHIYISEVTYQTNHVIPEDLSVYYRFFPLYHILISQASYILGLDVKASLFIITGPIFVITILFLYKIASKISCNSQIALLSCLLYSADSSIMYYGTYVVTRTLAFVAFIIIFYFVYKSDIPTHKVLYKLMAIYICVFLVLVHQVSVVQISFLLFLFLICEFIMHNERYFSKNYFVLINTIFISYWFFVAYAFTNSVLKSHFQAALFEELIIISSIGTTNEWIYLFTHSNMSVFIFFALVGIGYLLFNEEHKYASAIGLFTLLTFILYIPSPIQTLWQTINLFTFDRFALFLTPFMAVIMAYGIYLYYTYDLKCNLGKYKVVPMILFVMFTFIGLTYSISDSHDLYQNSPHTYFTSKEVTGFHHIFDHVQFGSTLYSDYYSLRYFIQADFEGRQVLNIPYYETNQINVIELIPTFKGYTILRTEELTIRGLFFGTELQRYLFRNKKENILLLYSKINTSNRIYSNSAVDIYFK